MITKQNLFYVESLGCIANQVDSNRIRHFFLANDWVEVKSPLCADTIILMTCAVTKTSETHNIKRLEELKYLKKQDSQIIIGGCLPAINKDELKKSFNGLLFTPKSLKLLDSLFAKKVLISEISPVLTEQGSKPMQSIRISTGCWGKCSFCAIPYANGRTKSRKINEIMKDIQSAVKTGIKQIKLVSEDVGAYGLDFNSSIIELLKNIVNEKNDFSVFLDTINFCWFKKFKIELLDLLDSDKFIKSLCIPVQSGSNRILKSMKRGYSIEEADEIYSILHDKFPSIKISTDFLVGFPTETEKEFYETVTFFERFDFNHVQIFTYEDRPNVESLKLKPKIPDLIKEQRRQILLKTKIRKLLKDADVHSKKDMESFLSTYSHIPINLNMIL